ncbi:hypothetical protein FCI23_36015 [Actinacidiphila oryziradicis]|uniref:Uncharacterized protein n=1 Tax=Actinacidiphila oryziradicis TaxID=2571141 RepID=A0A4U0S6E7_9ACTN|nr:hypothetical protein FCI23_36015 [Actinacidiphila oryziradicis]
MPYVRGWATAKRAADTLAAQLRVLGFEPDFLGLKADVSVFGDGLVCLGPVRPEAIQLLAEALATGLTAEMASAAGTTELPDASAA